VLQQSRQFGTGIDGAAASVRVAEARQLLEHTGPQTIEIGAELFDFASHIDRR
jgi:hypothetical protein